MSAAPSIEHTPQVNVIPATHDRVAMIASESGSLANRVASLVISDQASLEAASSLLTDVKRMRDEVKLDLGGPKEAAHKLWKSLGEVFKKHDDPLAQLEARVKGAIGDYHAAEERRARIAAAEAEAKARKEAEEQQLAEAAALEAAGNAEAAEQVLNEEPPPPPPPPPAAPKAKGISVRENWKAQIADPKALISAAAGGDPVALSIVLDKAVVAAMESRASAVAKALKSELIVPGVRAYADRVVAGSR